ncbi:MAG: DUF448 domain-containing protein [Actinobacteria bacterium]|nr:DUF448 domain-containing protein [Actinomycetota bacterium]
MRRPTSTSCSRPRPRSRAATREANPTRTCVGCGRRAPKDALDRFASLDGVLTSGRTLPGRGVYVCRARAFERAAAQSCFERAAARRAFARSLGEPVSIPRHYTDASNG